MRTIALLLPLALLAAPVFAEEPPVSTPATPAPAASAPPTPGAGMMMPHRGGMGMMGGPGMGMGGGMMGNCPMMKGEHIEGRVAFLHTELKITPAQEEVWKGYADAMRANATAKQERRDAMREQRGENQSVPADMASHIAMMEQKLAGMKALQAATEKLYGVLTDDQKKTADELLGHFR